MDFMFGQMNEEGARAVLGWRYDEPYSFYNPNPSELEKEFQALTDSANLYYVLKDENGVLVAYFCFGQEAQVAGGDYSDDALNVGGGVRPDLTGRGFGPLIIRAGLDFAQLRFAPRAFRVTVAAFNERALRLCKRIGFSPVRTFSREQDKREFVILLKGADGQALSYLQRD